MPSKNKGPNPTVQPITITPNPIPRGQAAVARAENLPSGTLMNFQWVTADSTELIYAGHAGQDGVIERSFIPDGSGTCTFQHNAAKNKDTVYAEGSFTVE